MSGARGGADRPGLSTHRPIPNSREPSTRPAPEGSRPRLLDGPQSPKTSTRVGPVPDPDHPPPSNPRLPGRSVRFHVTESVRVPTTEGGPLFELMFWTLRDLLQKFSDVKFQHLDLVCLDLLLHSPGRWRVNRGTRGPGEAPNPPLSCDVLLPQGICFRLPTAFPPRRTSRSPSVGYTGLTYTSRATPWIPGGSIRSSRNPSTRLPVRTPGVLGKVLGATSQVEDVPPEPFVRLSSEGSSGFPGVEESEPSGVRGVHSPRSPSPGPLDSGSESLWFRTGPVSRAVSS